MVPAPEPLMLKLVINKGLGQARSREEELTHGDAYGLLFIEGPRVPHLKEIKR